jgi:hypothetical protein
MLAAALETMAAPDEPVPLEDLLGPLRESLAAFAVPDFECIMQPAPPTPPAVSTGLEGFDSSWSDFAEAFTDFRLKVEEARQAGDYFIANALQIARTRYGGVEITQPSSLLIQFEGNRVVRIEFHIDRDEALRRAGLA